MLFTNRTLTVYGRVGLTTDSPALNLDNTMKSLKASWKFQGNWSPTASIVSEFFHYNTKKDLTGAAGFQ